MLTIGCAQHVCACRELDVDTEPAQQRDHRLAGVGEHRVVDARDHQRDAHADPSCRRHRAGSTRGLGRIQSRPRPARSGARRACGAPARASRPGRAGRRRGRAPAPARCPARPPRPGRRAPAARSASAVSRQSRAFCERRRRRRARPRPRRPASSAAVRTVAAVGQRRGCPGCSAPSRPGSPAVGWPCSRQPAARSGRACRPAAGTRGSSTSTTVRRAPARRPPRRAAGQVDGRVSAPRRARHSDSTQRPITLLQEADRAVDAALVGEVRRPRPPRSAPARRARARPATRCREEM